MPQWETCTIVRPLNVFFFFMQQLWIDTSSLALCVKLLNNCTWQIGCIGCPNEGIGLCG